VEARLILLCGLPGSGKTTLARQLASRVRGVRLGPDEWMLQLGLDLFDEKFRSRLEDRFWHLAQDLLRLDVSVILESGFWSRSERDEKRLAARALGARVQLHLLDVPLEELSQRLAARWREAPATTVHITDELLREYAGYFEPPDPDELALFDPS
jgi:predicted kinase